MPASAAGVVKHGATGLYSADVSLPDDFQGSVVWDDTVSYAYELVDYT